MRHMEDAMKANHSLRASGVLLALSSGLALGWLVMCVWPSAVPVEARPSSHEHAIQAAQVAQAPALPDTCDPLSQPALANVPNVPEVTSTPVLPDFIPQVEWDGRYPCPYPMLRLTSYNNENTPCLG